MKNTLMFDIFDVPNLKQSDILSELDLFEDIDLIIYDSQIELD